MKRLERGTIPPRPHYDVIGNDWAKAVIDVTLKTRVARFLLGQLRKRRVPAFSTFTLRHPAA